MALTTSAESPIPVSEVSRLIRGWIDRLGAVWVEGQIVQLSPRPGAGIVFLTLRDPSREVSLSVTCFRQVYEQVKDVIGEGARVVVHAKPESGTRRRAVSRCAPPRSARWGWASCWRGWSGCGRRWRPRGCSRRSASGRCRSCRSG